MRRKYQEQIDELQSRIRLQRGEIDLLRALVERHERRWCDLDNIIEYHINGKMRVTVVENLAAYEKGSKIAKDIKHIEEIIGK